MRSSASIGADGTLRVHEHQRRADWLTKRKGQRIQEVLLDEAAIRSERQHKYWFGCVVKTVQETWQQSTNAELPIPKEFVHDRLVSVFGGEWFPTPLGPGRRSETTMTIAEMSAMIDDVAEWLHTKYPGVVLPKPEEWSEHA